MILIENKLLLIPFYFNLKSTFIQPTNLSILAIKDQQQASLTLGGFGFVGYKGFFGLFSQVAEHGFGVLRWN